MVKHSLHTMVEVNHLPFAISFSSLDHKVHKVACIRSQEGYLSKLKVRVTRST